MTTTNPRTAAELAAIDAENLAMYTAMVGDADLAQRFHELEDELLNPDTCDHGDLGRAGCAVASLRTIAEMVQRLGGAR